MKFREYGNANGTRVIYFHGAPGSPEECAIFDQHAKDHDLNIICYDRFSADPSLETNDYYQLLADLITSRAGSGQVDIIGFSIGCHVALETSLLLGDRVRQLHLISAAAPLEAGEFLDDMAGKMVFLMAKNYPKIFTALSYWQAFLSRVAPNVLFNMLFASAAGDDKKMANDAAFRSYMRPILSACFETALKGYIRDVNQYVSPWEKSVTQCKTHTHLWHGASDNWSPVSMATYLVDAIQAPSQLEVLDGQSHYSCLYTAAPKICQKLAIK